MKAKLLLAMLLRKMSTQADEDKVVVDKIMKEISKKVLHFILLSLNFIYIIYNTVQYNLYNKFTIIKFNLQYRCMYISNLLHNFLTVDFETNK